MKILDRYILKKFFLTFFFCIVAMTMLVVIVDLSERTDDFAQAGLPAKQIITEYYFGFVPRLDAMLFPLFIFISVIFFTSKMANNSEVIAILSSGVSFKRYLLPYFIGGVFFTGILWGTNRYILPQANDKWSTFKAKYIDFNYRSYVNTSTISNKHFKLDKNSYAGFRFYDTTSKSGSNLLIQKFDGTELVYSLFAQGFRWDTATNDWKLSRVRMRTISGLRQQLKDTPALNMSYNFKPVDLKSDIYLKDRMPTSELNEFIRMEKIRGGEDINSLILEKENRNAVPVSVLVLTIIGATIASKKVRGGRGIHLAIGVVICVLYILVGRFSSVYSVNAGFNPVLAAWLPNIIFAGLAYYLYKNASK